MVVVMRGTTHGGPMNSHNQRRSKDAKRSFHREEWE
jgi:hypothetical protein